MTGLGTGEASLAGGRVFLETRSVNHRYLDVRARLPREMIEHTSFVEQAARARLSRGRVEILGRLDAGAGATLVLDKAKAAAALRALTELRDELGLVEPVPLSLLATVPDLFIVPGQGDPDAVRAALGQALEASIVGLDSMRRSEGVHLQADLRARLGVLDRLCDELTAFAPGLADRYRVKLRERITRLLESTEARLDPSRLEQEVALVADRADVTEEITRLTSHCRQFATLLDAHDAVGRKLDFLLQEMAREVNTLGAKSSEAGIALRVVDLKAEIERMREQMQNIE